MHCGRYRLRNEDSDSVITKVVIKQFHYIPITPRLKWLFLSKEIPKQMMWHKEEKYETEDPDIISHLVDREA
jgi:hypothetical protein